MLKYPQYNTKLLCKCGMSLSHHREAILHATAVYLPQEHCDKLVAFITTVAIVYSANIQLCEKVDGMDGMLKNPERSGTE